MTPSFPPDPSFQPNATPPARSRTWLYVLVASIAVLALVCCGIAGFAGFGGVRLFQSIQREADQGMLVIDQFMRAGAARDTGAALALFDPKADVAAADLNQLFQERADAFANYTKASQSGFNIHTDTTETTAALSGTLAYSNHADRGFDATLRKEAGQWKLVSIRFNDGVGE